MTHLDDNLDDIFPASSDLSAPTPALPRGAMKQRILNGARDNWQAEGPAIHKDKCEGCGGTGIFRTWAGRDGGNCFKCKGQGFRMFKTSAASRKLAREKTAERKVSKEREAIEAFAAAHPEAHAWIKANEGSFEFARNMGVAVNKWGSLTDKQMAAIERCIAGEAKRKAERAAAKANAPEINIDGIEKAFAAAAARGKKRLKLFIGNFEFAPAKPTSRNPGAVYVKCGSSYLGKIVAGKFHKEFMCDQVTANAVIEQAARVTDFESLKVIGQQTGVCCCCGAELTDPESVANGIGPICQSKWGF